jgi:ribonucrease Y
MEYILHGVVALVALALGVGLAAAWFASRQRQAREAVQRTIEDAKRTLDDSKRDIETRLKAEQDAAIAQQKSAAQAELTRHRQALEADLARERAAVAQDRERAAREVAAAAEVEERARRRETKLTERETSLDRKLEAVDARDNRLRTLDAERDQGVIERVKALDQREQSIDTRLSEVSGLSRDQAREEILRQLDASLTAEQSERIARHEKDLQARNKELAVEIVGRAIQRYAAEHTAETTSAKIKLADEEMKGRIIGKEGRNIKAFEQATGVDLLLDDQPGVLTISCFSGLRREMARRTLMVLLEDGRIHPGRIEEVMAKVQQDMDREVFKLGEDAAFAVEVSGLHPQLLRLLGKLQWRTSYGQNVLQHTQEVAFLCGAMAADMGLDAKLGRRCGLMHDIGKAIDHEQEGSHPELGYEALKRYGESEIVANAALAHHEGHPVLSAYTVLAAAADAISAARPGARSKNVEGYIKRLEKLEEIACAQHGVQKAYCIQAGRELRVIVSGRDVADADLPKLARDIAKRIEDEVTFPGEVKVTIIRELRHTAVAR